MKLHENIDLFKESVQTTAERMGIYDIYIEKDYWVCYALKLIYESKIRGEIIFKGGTALSKCYKYIDRFSEDIDLVVLRKEKETGNQLKGKLKKVTKAVTEPFEEIAMEGITNKMGMIRKIAYNYPKTFKGKYGPVRDFIIIEATWLGYFEPYSKRTVNTYLYDMMVAANQTALAKEYDLMPLEALVLDARRTFCEKIMSLVRFSHTKNPIEDLNAKIRHVYDIHQLLKDEDIQTFFNSSDFEVMLIKVANDDVQGFKNNNEWLRHHPKEALIFKSPKETWNQLKDTYQNVFKNLVFGDLPNEEGVLSTIQEVSERMAPIKWTIST